MAPVDASAILGLWEESRGLDAISRSVSLCAAAEPVVGIADAAEMPIGERNARLLRLRSLWRGGEFEATAQCPRCGAALEFSVDPADLLEGAELGEVRPVRVHDRIIHWRPITSVDLLRAAGQPDERRAERAIIDRCVKEVFEDGHTLVGYEPTSVERAALAAAIEDSDPLCDLLFNLDCVECGGSVTADLQVPDAVWNELENVALKLVSEVHTLAKAYGWTETECLALSPARRSIYLELATGGVG